MKGKGLFSKQIKDIFDMSCKKTGIQGNRIKLDTSHFKRVNLRQLSLFE